MFEITWWAIVVYYTFLIVLLTSFNFYLKKKGGEGMGGHLKVPKKYLWIFTIGMFGVWMTLINPIIFLFYPNIQDFLLPITILRAFSFEVLGLTLIGEGCTIITIAILQLGLSARFYLPKQPTNLITTGIYRFCRNPIYLGHYICTIGVFFLLPSFVFLIGFVMVLVNQHMRIQQEEKFLKERFGTKFEKYCQRVGRYLPISS